MVAKARAGYSVPASAEGKVGAWNLLGAPSLLLGIPGRDVAGSIWTRGDRFGEHLGTFSQNKSRRKRICALPGRNRLRSVKQRALMSGRKQYYNEQRCKL
jgi:hypothetical protein